MVTLLGVAGLLGFLLAARMDGANALPYGVLAFAARGASALVRPDDRARMTSDGLSEADIAAVQGHLKMLRVNKLVPTNHHILRRMIDGVGATPTAMNIDVAQGTYFRGMKLALAEIDRRYGDRSQQSSFSARSSR